MREALESHTRGEAPTLEEINARLGDVSNGARAQWGGEQSRAAGAAAGANLSRGRGARARRSTDA
jgi:5-methyltetrahydrofolate--homocysteine methyltransferase